jgi:transposase
MKSTNILTEEQRSRFLKIAKSTKEPHGIARKANALILLDRGMNAHDISICLLIDEDTVRKWKDLFVKNGEQDFFSDNRGGRQGHLNKIQIKSLIRWVETTVPSTIKQIIDFVNRRFGVLFSRSGAIKLMNKLGFKYKKPRKLPAVADEKLQKNFIKSYNDLQNNLKDDEIIYFADAVHPEYQARPTFGWLKIGIEYALRCTSGRVRTNIHAALNLENGNIVFTNTLTVDAKSTISLLKKIENTNKDKRKIYVILDNARYHHAKIVRKWLNHPNCRIELIFLPPYCPHLNPIERLWGVLHKYVTHNKYYEKFVLFHSAVLYFLKITLPNIWNTIRDTVSDNFRIISHKDYRIL